MALSVARRRTAIAVLLAAPVLALVLWRTVWGPTPAALDPSADRGGCPEDGHRNLAATGFTPEDIPKLPSDFSFLAAGDDCSPVRWNACRPVHYVINPAGAPSTGVADVREAFRLLGRATGITYIDDGTSDEDGGGFRAYQPDRYGERWAPILVNWREGPGTHGDVQLVGGGSPTRVGDVYVSGELTLNPAAIINKQTRAPVPGGFTDKAAADPIGPEGVTWGRIILHELAHVAGLGHVDDTSQLMYPETSDQTGPTAFGDGDQAGLRLLGRGAGCLETPAPGAPPSDGSASAKG